MQDRIVANNSSWHRENALKCRKDKNAPPRVSKHQLEDEVMGPGDDGDDRAADGSSAVEPRTPARTAVIRSGPRLAFDTIKDRAFQNGA